jgi:hypothetical protein
VRCSTDPSSCLECKENYEIIRYDNKNSSKFYCIEINREKSDDWLKSISEEFKMLSQPIGGGFNTIKVTMS